MKRRAHGSKWEQDSIFWSCFTIRKYILILAHQQQIIHFFFLISIWMQGTSFSYGNNFSLEFTVWFCFFPSLSVAPNPPSGYAHCGCVLLFSHKGSLFHQCFTTYQAVGVRCPALCLLQSWCFFCTSVCFPVRYFRVTCTQWTCWRRVVSEPTSYPPPATQLDRCNSGRVGHTKLYHDGDSGSDFVVITCKHAAKLSAAAVSLCLEHNKEDKVR